MSIIEINLSDLRQSLESFNDLRAEYVYSRVDEAGPLDEKEATRLVKNFTDEFAGTSAGKAHGYIVDILYLTQSALIGAPEADSVSFTYKGAAYTVTIRKTALVTPGGTSNE